MASGLAGESIDEVLSDFLDTQRAECSATVCTRRRAVVDFLAASLNRYGYQGLRPGERRRWQAAFDADDDPEAFTRLFGPDKIPEHVPVFMGYFLPAKVISGRGLLRAAGPAMTVLLDWLCARRYLDAGAADIAREQATALGRALPGVDALAEALYQLAADAPRLAVGRLAEPDYLVGILTIERVAEDALWFADGIGPVHVPESVSRLAETGWRADVTLARDRSRWWLLQAGFVYP